MPTNKDNTAMKLGNSGSMPISNEKGNPLQDRDGYNDDVLKGGDSRGEDMGNERHPRKDREPEKKEPVKSTEPKQKLNPENIDPAEEFISPNANIRPGYKKPL
jgi:hypothetical protein